MSKKQSANNRDSYNLEKFPRHVAVNYLMLTYCLLNDNIMFVLWFSIHSQVNIERIKQWIGQRKKDSCFFFNEKNTQNLDKHSVNLNYSPISKQIVTQEDLNTHIIEVLIPERFLRNPRAQRPLLYSQGTFANMWPVPSIGKNVRMAYSISLLLGRWCRSVV